MNCQLQYYVQKLSIKDASNGEDKFSVLGYLESVSEFIDTDIRNFSKILSPPKYQKFSLERRISGYELMKANLDMMPGFKISWHYSGSQQQVQPQPFYLGKKPKPKPTSVLGSLFGSLGTLTLEGSSDKSYGGDINVQTTRTFIRNNSVIFHNMKI